MNIVCHSPVFLILKYTINLIISFSHDSYSLNFGTNDKSRQQFESFLGEKKMQNVINLALQ